MAKYNVRNYKKRRDIKGENWVDVNHAYFREKYDEHIKKFHK